MAKDDPLLDPLKTAAAASNGRIEFQARALRELGPELGIDLNSFTRQSVYDFTVKPPGGVPFRCVAYKNIVDVSKTHATRVESLGRSLAVGGGKLFELNPFLLVFDQKDEQFMAVSAAALFDAFATKTKSEPLQKSPSAYFSMSPNFANRTITMYADAPKGAIWHAALTAGLTADALFDGLVKMRDDSANLASEIPQIVKAIEARIGDPGPPAPTPPVVVNAPAPAAVATVPVPESAELPIRVDERIRRMVMTAIRSAPAVILVGPPGTGKTALLREVFREVALDPSAFGLPAFEEPLWATPDESWTVRELVGGETIVGEAIRFRPGLVLQAITGNRWLVLDEVNRADMDRIFGGLLTWLSGGSVTLGTASTDPGAPHIELAWNTDPNTNRATSKMEGIDPQGTLVGIGGKVRYAAGEGWRLLGTYNALDAQRVFRFGAALGRRFVRVPIPAPSPALFAEVLAERAAGIPAGARAGVEGLYNAHYAKEETQLGPAVFLAMCSYLRASLPPPGASDGSGTGTPTATDDGKALAEAYVVHAGTWLAHLDRRDFDALGERVRSGVMSPEEWSWVTQMIRSLA